MIENQQTSLLDLLNKINEQELFAAAQKLQPQLNNQRIQDLQKNIRRNNIRYMKQFLDNKENREEYIFDLNQRIFERDDKQEPLQRVRYNSFNIERLIDGRSIFVPGNFIHKWLAAYCSYFVIRHFSANKKEIFQLGQLDEEQIISIKEYGYKISCLAFEKKKYMKQAGRNLRNVKQQCKNLIKQCYEMIIEFCCKSEEDRQKIQEKWYNQFNMNNKTVRNQKNIKSNENKNNNKPFYQKWMFVNWCYEALQKRIEKQQLNIYNTPQVKQQIYENRLVITKNILSGKYLQQYFVKSLKDKIKRQNEIKENLDIQAKKYLKMYNLSEYQQFYRGTKRQEIIKTSIKRENRDTYGKILYEIDYQNHRPCRDIINFGMGTLSYVTQDGHFIIWKLFQDSEQIKKDNKDKNQFHTQRKIMRLAQKKIKSLKQNGNNKFMGSKIIFIDIYTRLTTCANEKDEYSCRKMIGNEKKRIIKQLQLGDKQLHVRVSHSIMSAKNHERWDKLEDQFVEGIIQSIDIDVNQDPYDNNLIILMFEPEQVILSGGGKKEEITQTCKEIRKITNEKRDQLDLQNRLSEDLSTRIKPFSSI